MANKNWRAALAVLCTLLLSVTPVRPLLAQPPATAHALTFSNATAMKDGKGRIIIVGHVSGDLPGILTLALSVNANGLVTSGEWALNVSFTQFGAPDPHGDGDPSEVLVQRGLLKGSINGGNVALLSNGMANSANGLSLSVTSATMQFATVKAGTGSFTGGGLTAASTANGTLNLTF